MRDPAGRTADATKLPRSKPGTNRSRTSAFTLPKVVSGLGAMPSVNASRIRLLKSRAWMQGGDRVAVGSAEVVDPGGDVQQLRVVAEATVAGQQAAPRTRREITRPFADALLDAVARVLDLPDQRCWTIAGAPPAYECWDVVEK